MFTFQFSRQKRKQYLPEPIKSLLFHQVQKDFMSKIKMFKLLSLVVLNSTDAIVQAA